jgi:S1-C subfamily serine protease
MNLLDLALLGSFALSAWVGHRMGLLVRAAGLLGFVAGVGLSALTIPFGVELIAPSTAAARVITPLAIVTVTVLVVSSILQAGAVMIRRKLEGTPLSTLDRMGGAVAGVAGVAMMVWFAAPLAGMVPGTLARQVRGSTVVSAITELAPEAPNPLATIQSLVSDSRFPEVFSDLAQAPAVQPPPESIPVSQETVAMISASTVKVEAAGCGSQFAGSGWAVGTDLIVTNAHVVAGADDVQVLLPDGSRTDGTVVAFDDDRDLALIEVPGLGQNPLILGEADDGEGAAAFGHPGGQDELRVAPALVSQQINAIGRDIYGQDRTEREVIVLGAELQQGDSGSAVVDSDGTVIGTVFAISPDDRGTAYALSNTELRSVLGAPRDPGNTGRCA